MLSVAFGVGLVVISFSVLLGFKEAITNKLFSFGGHIQISKISLNNSEEEKPLNINSKIITQKKDILNIESINFTANKVGLLKSDFEQVGIILKGIDSFENSQFKLNLIEGNLPKITKDSIYSKGILISNILYKKLNIKLNDELLANFPPKARRLKVVGVYETGLEEIDKSFIIGDLKLIQKLNNWKVDEAGKIEIFLKNINFLKQTNSQIIEKAELDLQVSSTQNLYPEIFDWLKMLDRNAEIMLILILIVAAFNMISVVIIMMMERSEMIGLIKTLGGTDFTVKKVFASMAFRIIFKGLLIGNLSGILICLIQYHFKIIPLDSANYFISYVPIKFNLSVIFFINTLFLILVTLSVFIPIQIITKMSPILALKFRK